MSEEQAINRANHFQIYVFPGNYNLSESFTIMDPQLYLLQLLQLSSVHNVSDVLEPDFIVAVTKPAQSPTIEEKEMTNKNM